MRATRQPGWAARAARVSAITGAAAKAGGSRSLRWAASQSKSAPAAVKCGGAGSGGLAREARPAKTAAVALCVALGLQAFSMFVVDPLAVRFTGQTADLSDFRPVVGNVKLVAIYLLLIWSFAAIGEEFAYRGYLLRRTIEALGGSTRGSVAAVLLCGALFGIGHYYQGLVGMVDSTVSGLVFGTLYVKSGGNLWPSTLAHGFTDTLALGLIASGAYAI